MRRLVVMIMILCAGCGYNDFDRIIVPEYETEHANVDIGYLKSLYKGEPVNITEDVVVAGYVTANDESNNFYRTFIIEDPTGAIEVKAGMFDLHNTFYYGRLVAVRMRGLALGGYNGVLQVGRKPAEGGSQTGYIANRYYPGSFFRPQTDSGEITPMLVRLDDLTDDMCGRLVRVGELRFEASGYDGQYAVWAENGTTGFRAFADGNGNRITVTTSGYAGFAGEQVPRRELVLTGILMKGNTDKERGVFMLKLRDIDDVEEV